MQDNHNKQRAVNIQETETQETGRCVTGKVDNGNGDTVVFFFFDNLKTFDKVG